MVQSAPPQGFRPVQKKRRWGCALFYCNWKGRPGKCHAAILRIGEASVDCVTAPLHRGWQKPGQTTWKIQTVIDLKEDFDGTKRFREFSLRLPNGNGHARQISIEPLGALDLIVSTVVSCSRRYSTALSVAIAGSIDSKVWSIKTKSKVSVLQDPRSVVSQKR